MRLRMGWPESSRLATSTRPVNALTMKKGGSSPIPSSSITRGAGSEPALRSTSRASARAVVVRADRSNRQNLLPKRNHPGDGRILVLRLRFDETGMQFGNPALRISCDRCEDIVQLVKHAHDCFRPKKVSIQLTRDAPAFGALDHKKVQIVQRTGGG